VNCLAARGEIGRALDARKIGKPRNVAWLIATNEAAVLTWSSRRDLSRGLVGCNVGGNDEANDC
jgi:hypothetical protein